MRVINTICCVVVIGLLVGYCAKHPSLQQISGRWQGYYVYDFPIYDSVLVVERDSTRLTIDISPLNDSMVSCKTISGDFADAEGTGKFNKDSDTLLLSETKITLIKQDTSGIEICLSNYFLKYRRSGSQEQLLGTMKSQPNSHGTDCGGGDIYLKKVAP